MAIALGRLVLLLTLHPLRTPVNGGRGGGIVERQGAYIVERDHARAWLMKHVMMIVDFVRKCGGVCGVSAGLSIAANE